MKYFSIILSAFLLSACQTSGGPQIGKPLLNGDGFYSNCPPPSFGSLSHSGNTMVFKLADGDIGGCPSDNSARHVPPYWERMELRQNDRLSNGSYSFSYDLKIEGGFSFQTTIFQLHTWSSDCTECKPFFMQKIVNAGLISTNNMFWEDSPKIKIKIGKTYNYEWKFNIDSEERIMIKLYLDKKLTKKYMRSWYGRGSPHIKFGIYRPGMENTPNPTVIHTVSNIVFKRLK